MNSKLYTPLSIVVFAAVYFFVNYQPVTITLSDSMMVKHDRWSDETLICAFNTTSDLRLLRRGPNYNMCVRLEAIQKKWLGSSTQ